MSTKKAMLVILDGWGLGPVPAADAIAQANTPVFDHLWKHFPHSTLVTYGQAVGLPEGQMGNSEVGHLNIGAGRVVYQELARINKAVRTGELARNEKLQAAIKYAKAEGKAIHLMGLVSDGGVHSHLQHLLALVDIIAAAGHEQTYIHAFTDGRDTDPQSGKGFLQTLLQHLPGKHAHLATVIGRYFAMDRDQRWERIKLAYDLIVKGEGEPVTDALAALQARYDQGETDEFIQPMVIRDPATGLPPHLQDGDVLLCFNFRTDRPRQISEVLTQRDFSEFGMKKLAVHYLTMTRYDEKFTNLEVLFEKSDLTQTLGEVLAANGKTQVRIAETEKYAHVTFFFNGGREAPFPNERRLLIPSPKEVATYDLKPEMSAEGITEAIVADIKANQPDFICLNFANADMVGHTGVFAAAIRAAETVDRCLGQLLETGQEFGYEAIIIADHGNSDYLRNPDGSPNTAHTMNPVPCIYVHNRDQQLTVHDGKLADVAPTLLWMMGLPAPAEMDGEVLIHQL
ncbi:MAG: 2,3-bisphosphoglycerate-independent phosphoglycerate mutase [Bacteroidetes bacterium]|nr:MAG: 2,3-bisphosphoglycerate-independent phosphoglycerate mutase [Bacteroidota bacterium]